MIKRSSHRRVRLGFPQNTNLIAVDVDGTLLVRGEKNEKLVVWLERQKAKGKKLLLWSARGEDHARETAERFEVAHLFSVIIGKPEAIVDDKGWDWIRFTKIVRSIEPEEQI